MIGAKIKPLCLDSFVRCLRIYRCDREVFNLLSKVITELLWFCLTTLCDWLKNSRQLLNQSDAKTKLIVTWSHAFPREFRRLRLFALSSHWFIVLFSFVVIGHCNCFGFGFTTLN